MSKYKFEQMLSIKYHDSYLDGVGFNVRNVWSFLKNVSERVASIPLSEREKALPFYKDYHTSGIIQTTYLEKVHGTNWRRAVELAGARNMSLFLRTSELAGELMEHAFRKKFRKAYKFYKNHFDGDFNQFYVLLTSLSESQRQQYLREEKNEILKTHRVRRKFNKMVHNEKAPELMRFQYGDDRTNLAFNKLLHGHRSIDSGRKYDLWINRTMTTADVEAWRKLFFWIGKYGKIRSDEDWRPAAVSGMVLDAYLRKLPAYDIISLCNHVTNIFFRDGRLNDGLVGMERYLYGSNVPFTDNISKFVKVAY